MQQCAVGDAAAVWKKINSTYGTVKSTESKVALLDQLKYVKKANKESIEDFIARVDALISDLKYVGETTSLAQRKYYILEGLLSHDDWILDVKMIRKMDPDDEWSEERFDQQLISEEHSRRVRAMNKTNDKQTDNAFYVQNNQNRQNNGFRSRGNFRGRGRGRFVQGNNNHNNSTPQHHSQNQTDSSRNSKSFEPNSGFRGRGGSRGGYTNNNNERTCYNCGGVGHIARKCPSEARGRSNDNAMNVHDSNENDDSQTNDWSFMVRQRESTLSNTPRTTSQTTSMKHAKLIQSNVVMSDFMKFHEIALNTHLSMQDWVLDTGATRHFTCDRRSLFDVRKLSTPCVAVTNNAESSFNMVGKMKVKIGDGMITLNDVAYLPDFKTNLISISRMADKGFEVICGKECAIVRHKGKVIFTVPRRGNLYVHTTEAAMTTDVSDDHNDASVMIDSETVAAKGKPTNQNNSSNEHEIARNFMKFNEPKMNEPKAHETKTNDAKVSAIKHEMRLMHAKYGHMSYQAIWKLVKNDSVTGMNVLLKKLNTQTINELSNERCEGCLEGKMVRYKLTGKIDYDKVDVMNMWVADTIGPIRMTSIGGNKYVLNLCDVGSRKIICRPMKHMSDAAGIIISEIKKWEKRTALKLKWFHSDGGREFVNGTLETYFKENGIVHTVSIPYTPEHNGMAERVNRTEIEMARSMLRHAISRNFMKYHETSKSVLALWGEAFVAAGHILDRRISKADDKVTPIELIGEKKPDVSKLHVFACDVYYYNHPSYRENKLDVTGKKGIFVGYDENNDDYYRIYDVDENKIVIARDVTFFEEDFDEVYRMTDENDDNGPKSNELHRLSADDFLSDDYDIEQLFRQPESNKNDSMKVHEISSNDKNENNDKEVQDIIVVDENKNDKRDEQEKLIANENTSDIGQRGFLNSQVGPGGSLNSQQLRRTGRILKLPKETYLPDDFRRRDVLLNTVIDETCEQEVQKERNEDSRNTVKFHEISQNKNLSRTGMFLRIPTAEDAAYSTSDAEPSTYKQAMESSDSDKWNEAMKDELLSLKKNDTYEVIEREESMKVIGCRWVYALKKDEHGKVVRYKARLVAKGYNQEKGIDFDETFAPVMKIRSMRLMFAASTLYDDVELEQLDIKTAFLNATVKETIYVEPAEGMNIDSSRYVLRLKRALYGIKQAPREWNANINEFLISLGFKPCIKDTCIYVKEVRFMKFHEISWGLIILGLFVDDMVALYNRAIINDWISIKNAMKNKYDISELGRVSKILGMRVTFRENKLYMDQSVYIDEKLKLFQMTDCKPHDVPEYSTKLCASSDELSDGNKYRAIVGSLLYAAISTRPDIVHAVNMVSRFMMKPASMHFTAAKKILHYLQGTRSYGLEYGHEIPRNFMKFHGNENGLVSLIGYSDSDWGGSLDDRKSTTGYCVFMNKNLISWHTRKQPTVALSSAEAELMAVVDVVKEILWMKQVLEEMKHKVRVPVDIHIDNQSAMKMAKNEIEHDRSKHIDIKYHFVKQYVNDGTVKLNWIATENQLADIFTKGLGVNVFTRLRDRMMKKVA